MKIRTKLPGAIALLSAIAISIVIYGQQALSRNSDVMDMVYVDCIEPMKHLKVISDSYAVFIVDAAVAQIAAHWKAYAATRISGEEARLASVASQQLAETLSSVAHAAGTIDNGTREISTSVEDLAKRTEQQAAALEETAAALDQITANVSSSSKRADEARSVAVRANASATESGQVAASAIDAMQRIEASSKEISSIISVIDEIAFQTNLLAPNAGVEAARAGEAGKGFAVVAQEVRELAQRSARAAREINALISNSTEQVEGGVLLVQKTDVSLKTIGDYIVTINHRLVSQFIIDAPAQTGRNTSPMRRAA